MSRADYGIDAPPVVRNLGIGGSAIFLIGIAAFVFISEPAWLMYILGFWGIFAGGSMLVTSLLMVWSSKVGKLHKRRTLIESLNLKETKQSLTSAADEDCCLIEAANHLPTGKAIGVDLWQSADQSGNHPDVTCKTHARKVSPNVSRSKRATCAPCLCPIVRWMPSWRACPSIISLI